MNKMINKFSLPAALLALALLSACAPQPAQEPQASPPVQQTAPDFTLANALGGDVSLADYRGRQPVLLLFHMAVG